MKKAVVYGAGNIGRGFIGQLLSESGYEVCFVDVATDIINKLNEDKAYPVKIVSNDGWKEEIVCRVSAIHGENTDKIAKAICSADLVATAVGVNALPSIIQPLCEGLRCRVRSNPLPLNIIICENLLDAGRYIRKLIENELGDTYKPWIDENLGLVEASIGRMVPVRQEEMKEGNILKVWVEPYNRLPVDKDAFKGGIPEIKNLVPFSPFGFYIKRKLFIHNMGHAMSAYLGYRKGYRYIYECVADGEIKETVESAMRCAAEALSLEYGVPLPELYAHVDDLLNRFSNKALKDSVERVGKDPVRKLGRNDRMVGAALCCEQYGKTVNAIAYGIAAGLTFDAVGDQKAADLQTMIKNIGVGRCIESVCGIEAGSALHTEILKQYQSMKASFEVVAAGHVCVDISPRFIGEVSKCVTDVLVPGRLVNMDGVVFSPGGPVANTGFSMARLGLKVLPMSNVGDDELGNVLNRIVYKEMGHGITLNKEVNTSYSVVLAMPGIDRIILHDPAGNNSFGANHVDYSELETAKLFHFGYPPLMKAMYQNDGAQLAEMFRRAKELAITTSLDMSLPDTDSESGKVDWEKILGKILPFVDIFLPSIEEVLFMLDRREYERVKKRAGASDFTKYIELDRLFALAERILGMGCAMVLIKCGEKGVYLKTAGRERLKRMGRGMPDERQGFENIALFKETYVVNAFKSALAGGDTTIAGFLSAMLRGYCVGDCLRVACMTGALCCTTYDAISGLLPLEKIFALAEKNPPRNRFADLERNFVLDNKYEVWVKSGG